MTARPSLGYPTRTAAIEALRKRGMETREIADELGTSTGNVIGLEWRAARPRSAASSGRHDPMITVPNDVMQQLRAHAFRRRISMTRLAARILAAVAGAGMVDQVLDGKRRKERKG